jgi:hypothetical protein
VAVSLAMSLRPTGKMVPLHHASKTLAFRKASYIHQVTLFQEGNVEFISALDQSRCNRGPELA